MFLGLNFVCYWVVIVFNHNFNYYHYCASYITDEVLGKHIYGLNDREYFLYSKIYLN